MDNLSNHFVQIPKDNKSLSIQLADPGGKEIKGRPNERRTQAYAIAVTHKRPGGIKVTASL